MSVNVGYTPFVDSGRATQTRILGPAPCAFPKLKGLHRFHLQLLGPDGDQLRSAVRAATDDLKPPEKVQWIVDVDAVEMM
jgi:primosomal protein N'